MLTASQPHVDLGLAQPLAERSPTFPKTYLCDFALVTKLSSRVIEGESPHHSSTPGANHHQCGDAVLQVGLCRQNVDATVDVSREHFDFMVSSYFTASDKSPDTHKEVTKTAWQCNMRHVPRFKRGKLLLHPNKQGSNTLRAPATKTQNTGGTQAQRQKNPRHTTEGQTKNRPRTTSIDIEKGGGNSEYTNPNE